MPHFFKNQNSRIWDTVNHWNFFRPIFQSREFNNQVQGKPQGLAEFDTIELMQVKEASLGVSAAYYIRAGSHHD